MTTFSLTVPQTDLQSTFYWQGHFGNNDRLQIAGLNGCMGALLVCQNDALMVHDSNTGYPHAKQKMHDFLTLHPTTNTIYLSYGHHHDQCQWLRQHHHKEVTRLEIFHDAQITLEFDGPNFNQNVVGVSRQVGDPIPRINKNAEFRYTSKNWDPDFTTNNCTVCHNPIVRGFLTSNKHHCRMCGHITCDSCSPKMNNGLSRGFVSPYAPRERICFNCVPPLNHSWTQGPPP